MEQELRPYLSESIVAISTPAGVGGIAVVRLSGADASEIIAKIWDGKDIDKFSTHTAHLGRIKSFDGEMIDEGVLTFFKAPDSFTGENVYEFSCHGSQYIQRNILNALLDAGARMANPGEFTQRAFINGKLDLMQAEAVADLIASNSKKTHEIALKQTRGIYSSKIDLLREDLIHLSSLLELELDFSEEDVEFADRTSLKNLLEKLLSEVNILTDSYALGNVIKSGIPVTIAGVPNAGKSTLLNRLLQDNKAIVSDIPGTTRDTIEDTIDIDGILFRFIDTAGIHSTDDPIEKLGIERTLKSIDNSMILIWIIDPTQNIDYQLEGIKNISSEKEFIFAINKSDLIEDKDVKTSDLRERLVGWGEVINISAQNDENISGLTSLLKTIVEKRLPSEENILLTNARHYEALKRASESLQRTKEGLEAGLSADFVSQDLREALFHIGTITGKITNDAILANIFSKFCIGK